MSFTLTKQQDIFRKSITIRVSPTYTSIQDPNFVNFSSIPSGQGNVSLNNFGKYQYKNIINLREQTNILDDDIISNFFINLPNYLEYFKFRLSFLSVERGNLVTTGNNPIPEANLPNLQDSEIVMILNNQYQFSMMSSSLENNSDLPNQVIDLKRSRVEKSEWIYINQGESNLMWTFEILVFPKTVVTRKALFLAQRFKNFNFTLEFEYKSSPKPSFSLEVEEKITMPNLYKMMETFLNEKEEKRKYKREKHRKYIDGISEELENKIRKRKPPKLLSSAIKPDSRENIENYLEQILKVLS